MSVFDKCKKPLEQRVDDPNHPRDQDILQLRPTDVESNIEDDGNQIGHK